MDKLLAENSRFPILQDSYQLLVAQRGSNIYYSLLSVSSQQRLAIITVRAFAYEINEIVKTCSDHTLALQKYAWWRGEVQQMASSTPTHPITQSLSGVINQFAIPMELVQEFMEGVAQDLLTTDYASLAELTHFHHHTAGAIERMIAYILGCPDPNTLIAVDSLGVCIQMVNQLKDLRVYLKQDRCYFAKESLEQFNITIEDLQKYQLTDQIRQLLSLQAGLAKNHYQLAIEQLKSTERSKIVSTIVLAELSLALLQQLVAPDSDVLQQQISITPLRKLLLTWRVRWRKK